MRSQASSAGDAAGRGQRRILLRLGQPPGAVARPAAARRVGRAQHAQQVHVVLDRRNAHARAGPDDLADLIDLPLALRLLPQHDALAVAGRPLRICGMLRRQRVDRRRAQRRELDHVERDAVRLT